MKFDDKSQLDEFSKRFATELLARFPDLEKYFVAPKDFQKANNLCLEIQCPYPAELQEPMNIWTEGGKEVTVGFDVCHTHFTCSPEQNESEIFAEALSFLDDVFEERIVVMSWRAMSKGSFGSSFHPPNEIESEIIGTPPGVIVRIRSWKGTFLRDHRT